MARALADIQRDVQQLSADERVELLKALISQIDAPAEADVEKAWLVESERRLAEIESGTAQTISGDEVLREARSRLK